MLLAAAWLCELVCIWSRLLINEINANHAESEAEGLARNQVLIQELNSNLAKVVAAAGAFWSQLSYIRL